MSSKADRLRNINEQIRITERLIQLNEQEQELIQQHMDALDDYERQLNAAMERIDGFLANLRTS